MLYSLLPDDYIDVIFVVFAIGMSKYFDLMLGNNNAIIFNSRYYRMVLVLGLFLGAMAVALNYVAIPLYGINGAAVATLVSIMLYSLAKLLFVVVKLKLFPFTWANLRAVFIGILIFTIFYYWDFGAHPLLSIIFKSILMSLVYWMAVIRWNISPDINEFAVRTIPLLRHIK